MSEKTLDTEQKIKEAARKIFHEKGFAATKTRDIAEEAGINLALLNYYFRSKEKLYDIIMLETIQDFFGNILLVLNDEKTSLHEKLELFVAKYIDYISKNIDIPLFILNEARKNPEEFAQQLDFEEKIKNSKFAQQFKKEVKKGNVAKGNPLHILMNISSLIIFPFIASPLIKAVTKTKQAEFDQMMKERKKLIPIWIDAMFKVK